MADWLQCGKAVLHLGDVDAQARCVAMIDRSEDPDQTLIDGLNLGTTGAPHLIRSISRNSTIMSVGRFLRSPVGRKQAV
ncbi:MAG: hypothetical protein VB142_12520, partial [Burkholderia sp.]